VLNKELESAIKEAEKFHGHLGPFLVIGVRMGNVAKRILNLNIKRNNRLRATAKIPLFTPYSCILDGIQATTQCTVGNRKLKIENSQREITVYFEVPDSSEALKISVNPKAIEELMNKFSEGIPNEELAWKISHMKENQLFTIEKR